MSRCGASSKDGARAPRARVVIAIVRATIALGLSSRHRHRHRHRASLARVASHRSFEHAPRKYR
jgi:hypothetical protein